MATNNPALVPKIETELWLHSPAMTVACIDVRGLKSKVFENHLSKVMLEVIWGSGEIDTQGLGTTVQKGNVVTIERGVPYQYSGKMVILATLKPGLIPETLLADDYYTVTDIDGEDVVKSCDRAFMPENREAIIGAL